MRQQIDCAVLVLEAHHSWMPQVLKTLEPSLNRIRIHPLEWEAGHDLDLRHRLDIDASVSLPVETLAQASIGLRRYDVVLLPVSMATLSWTRQALAAIPRGPFIPLLGILKDIRSAAIQDLLEMGMSDFVRLPVCPNEFRARLLHSVTAVPRPGSLREPSLNYGQTIAIARGVLPLLSDKGLREWLEMTKSKPVTKIMLPDDHVSNILAGMLPKGPESEQEKLERIKKEALECMHISNVSALNSKSSLIQVEPEKMYAKGHLKIVKAKIVEEFERNYIIEALKKNKGNIATAARYSGKHRRAFWALMHKYNIDAESFRR
jgi:CheY-like chemotaxis protein